MTTWMPIVLGFAFLIFAGGSIIQVKRNAGLTSKKGLTGLFMVLAVILVTAIGVYLIGNGVRS